MTHEEIAKMNSVINAMLDIPAWLDTHNKMRLMMELGLCCEPHPLGRQFCALYRGHDAVHDYK